MNRKFRSCFITGVTGSAGSYLVEYIIKKDKKTTPKDLILDLKLSICFVDIVSEAKIQN